MCDEGRGALGQSRMALLSTSIPAFLYMSPGVGIVPFTKACPHRATVTCRRSGHTISASFPWPHSFIVVHLLAQADHLASYSVFYFQNSHWSTSSFSPFPFPTLSFPIPLGCRRMKTQKCWILTCLPALGLTFCLSNGHSPNLDSF